MGVKIEPRIPTSQPTKSLPEVWTDEQVSILFKAATPRRRLPYTLLVQSGLHEGETTALRSCDLIRRQRQFRSSTAKYFR